MFSTWEASHDERVRPVTGGSSADPSRTSLCVKPARAAPITGATQNSQSC